MQVTAEARFTKRYRDVTEEKAGGATYTPCLLADFVAEKIIQTANVDGKDVIRVLDPAVGDGELLMSLLVKLKPLTEARIIVSGFDTNESALEHAHRRMSVAFPSVELQLKTENFLDFVMEQRGFSLGSSLFANLNQNSFDIVIANPPYVRTQIMGANQAQELASAFRLSGRVDLYHAFLIGMAHVLSPDGTAGIIVSNRFMTTKGGASVRSALRGNFCLKHIWDLGDTKIFEAAVLPAVILAQGTNSATAPSPAFTSIYETTNEATEKAINPIAALCRTGTVALTDGRRFCVRHGKLDSSGASDDVWRIATESGDAWLATVNAHTWDSFQAIGKIRVGVKTCADKVFIRDDWNNLAESQRPELLYPVTTHHIAGRFHPLPSKGNRMILYPYKLDEKERRAVDLAEYPRSRAYLESHRATLDARTYLIEAGRCWYELWVPQDPARWKAPKLVFKDISERPTFWVDMTGTIVNGDCYWLSVDHPGGEDLLWLAAAVANSTFAEAFYDHRFHNKLYSGRRRFITQYVEQFPLPDPHSKLASEMISAAKAIYDSGQGSETRGLETELDRMVWESFGLAFEEIGR